MFERVGYKIKILAKVYFAIALIPVLYFGIKFLFSDYDGFVLIGFAVLIGGGLVALISAWFMYGFGELIENVVSIDNRLYFLVNKAPSVQSIDSKSQTEQADNPKEQSAVDDEKPKTQNQNE